MNLFKKNKYFFFISICLFVNLIANSCKKGYSDRYGPFYVSNDTTVIMDGDMGSRVDQQFEKLIENYPNIKLIIMEDCPGSRNDEEMFKAAISLKNLSINTHLPLNGKIQSGAVDFFLAGTKRTKEEEAKIGVHSWSDGKNKATDYPIGHSEHLLYIEFYTNIGYTQNEAEDLYYFIINSASPNNIHWMTDQEIIDYKITTN